MAQGGTLATIESSLENDEVLSLLTDMAEAATGRRYNPHFGAWIGLSDAASEGDWGWFPSRPNGLDFVNWNGGEPNNAGNEDCGQMFINGES